MGGDVSMGVDPDDFDCRVVILGDGECVDAAVHGGGGGKNYWVEDGCVIQKGGAGSQEEGESVFSGLRLEVVGRALAGREV